MLNYTGDVPTQLWEVLLQAWKRPISLQGDYARQNAVGLALAASMGLLSTIKPDGSDFGNHWHVTTSGLTALHYKDLLK